LTELQCVTVLDGHSMSECTGMPNCLVFIRSNRNKYIAVHVTPLYMNSMHVTDC